MILYLIICTSRAERVFALLVHPELDKDAALQDETNTLLDKKASMYESLADMHKQGFDLLMALEQAKKANRGKFLIYHAIHIFPFRTSYTK